MGFSEENGGYSGQQNMPIAGIRCGGGRCDNKQLIVIGNAVSNFWGGSSWTGWFSEEGSGEMLCGSGKLVNEIQCSGSQCDNMRLSCASIRDGNSFRVVTSNTRTTGSF